MRPRRTAPDVWASLLLLFFNLTVLGLAFDRSGVLPGGSDGFGVDAPPGDVGSVCSPAFAQHPVEPVVAPAQLDLANSPDDH